MRIPLLLFALAALQAITAAPIAEPEPAEEVVTTTHHTSTTTHHTSTTTHHTTSTTTHHTTSTSTHHTTSTTTHHTSTSTHPATTTTHSTSITTSTSTSPSSPHPTSPTPTPSHIRNTGPRGLSFNDPSLTQAFCLSNQSSKISWSYNWASDPYYPGGWTANSYNPVLTFVPMLWSAADDLTSIWNANVANAVQEHGADAVLAFNEPDGCCWSCGNSCMNVSSAVAAYQQWIEPLASSLKLGAPAVTNGEGAGVGADWLNQFLGNCTACTVDFIPLHWYGDPADPAAFEEYVLSFWTAFQKPLWVTEFGTTGGTEAEIVSFLEVVLPWLDEQPYVQRYAYWMDSDQGSPYMLDTDGVINAIGAEFQSG